jgi:hypothetical protein
MILDIDIRVSSDNGVQVHQFTKHFDSRFEGRKIENGEYSRSKSFEDFLAEFLSGTGRVIRNQLISTTRNTTTYGVQKNKENVQNIEYTLRLGDSQFVSGKIPLDKLIHLSEISKLSNPTNENDSFFDEDSSYSTRIDLDGETLQGSSFSSLSSSSEPFILKHKAFQPSINLQEVDEMFQQIISTAVSRYEDSFYIDQEEKASFTECS